MLAFLAAAARDPLLREMTPFVLDIAARASVVAPTAIAKHLKRQYPQPVPGLDAAGHGAAAGLIVDAGGLPERQGHEAAQPGRVTPGHAAFALLLGYLCGLRASCCWTRLWTRLLDRTPAELADLAVEASRQGWLHYKAAGCVVEITFPGLLKPQEEKAAHDQIDLLRKNYQRICGLPWDRNVAGPQRVWLAVYDKEDERKLRLRLGLFEEATQQTGHRWHRLRPDRRLRRLAVQPR